MSSRSLRTLALALACPLAVLPAAGAQAASKKSAAVPSISSVKPLKLGVGDTLTISGRHFLSGRNRNTVVFKRDGGRAVFVRAGEATTKRIRVKVPRKLADYLARKDGQARPTRFRVRVLARRFGRRFTSTAMSPVIGPVSTTKAPGAPAGSVVAAPAAPPAGSPAGDCDGDGVVNSSDADDDNDLLSDSEEATLGLDACRADSDGDGLEDGWEFYSALSLNAVGAPPVPYPGRRPYPNPLDAGDLNNDYDGDGLAAWQEHKLWALVGPHATPLSYSGGLKSSNGVTGDDVRDADADGLQNWVEFNGALQPGWWAKAYKSEKPYTEAYAATDAVRNDTDGDGVLDGADDQDFDGWNNIDEQLRTPYRVQPFNPCLPDYNSLTCSEYPPFENAYPPFDTAGPLPPAPLAWP